MHSRTFCPRWRNGCPLRKNLMPRPAAPLFAVLSLFGAGACCAIAGPLPGPSVLLGRPPPDGLPGPSSFNRGPVVGGPATGTGAVQEGRPTPIRRPAAAGPERTADAAEEAEKSATMCVATEAIHHSDSVTGKRVETKLIQSRRKSRRRSYVGSALCVDDYS